MILINLFLNSHFLDFFSENSFTELKNAISKYSFCNPQNYWIYFSCFSNINSNEGVFSISSASIKILFEQINFINCSSTSEGGSIRSLSTSTIILNKVCGSECVSSSRGQFAYIYSNIENKIYYTSVIHSYFLSNFGQSECFFVKYPIFSNLNCSSIKTNRDSFGTFYQSPGYCNFSTICNCFSFDYNWGITIHHYQSDLTIYYYLIFVNNSQIDNSFGLFHVSSSSAEVFQSIFFSNKYELFSGSNIKVYNSYMQNLFNGVNGINISSELSIYPNINNNNCFYLTLPRTYDEKCKILDFLKNKNNNNIIINLIFIQIIYF